MELTLCASGLTRTEARSRIKSIKGTPDAALQDGTPDAADNDLSSLFAGFLSTIRS
jgi:ATP-dependent Clp protease protease subunit